MSDWKSLVFLMTAGLGVCGLIPFHDGTLMMPLWVSLPLVLLGAGLLFRHGLQQERALAVSSVDVGPDSGIPDET